MYFTIILGDDPLVHLDALSDKRRTGSGIKTRKQHSKNAGQKYAVKSAGAPDRSDRRAQATHLVNVGEIGADQRAEAASDVGKWR